MPIRRRYKPRRSRRKRTGLKRTVARLKRHVDMELMLFDVTTFFTADFVGGVTVLNAVPRGTDETSRKGNQIKASSVLLRITTENDVATQNSLTRFILFVDKQANGVTPPASEVLEDISTPLLAVISPLIQLGFRRFRVLRDWTVALSGTGMSTNIKKKFVRLSFSTRYNAGGATIAEVETNALQLLIISNIDSAASNPPRVSVYSRFRFVP